MTELIRRVPRWYRWGLLALIPILLVFGMGLIGGDDVVPHLRTSTVYVPAYWHVGTSTPAALSYNGTVLLVRTDNNSAGGIGGTWTSSLAAIPYPTRLDIEMYDLGSGSSALTCTSAVVYGRNSLGVVVSETVTGIDESESLTNWAYESISKVVWAGCYQGTTTVTDSSDRLAIRTTDHLGLPQPIGANTDVISLCTRRFPMAVSVAAAATSTDAGGDYGAAERTLFAELVTLTDELRTDLTNVGSTTAMYCVPGSNYTVNTRYSTIDMAAEGATQLLSGQELYIRVRGRAW